MKDPHEKIIPVNVNGRESQQIISKIQFKKRLDSLGEILRENEECSYISNNYIEPKISKYHQKLHLSHNPSIKHKVLHQRNI